ncbi:MAG: biotin/lipoyl-binding protein [Alphaproteobacteria bacterium]|nr:MAG: biotin/lipoyl-binding protein [Alphaproteobacteria bacterium]
MKRLRKSRRLDRMTNDVRARRRYFGQWAYILVISSLFLWLANYMFGSLIFLRAEGLVNQERKEIAVDFVASVTDVPVVEGEIVKAGDLLARLRSTEITESVASLSRDIANARMRRNELLARRDLLRGLVPIADKRAHDLTRLRALHEDGLRRGVATSIEQRQFLVDEYDAVLESERIKSELAGVDAQLAGLDDIMAKQQDALEQILESFGEGVVRAPVDGVVNNLHVATGSVVAGGSTMMEILYGRPYVLAFLQPGTLHRLKVGDEVVLEYGVEDVRGRVTQLFPVAAPLPVEFQKSFRPAERSQIVRIDFAENTIIPPTFTKVEVRAAGSFGARLAAAARTMLSHFKAAFASNL